MDTDAGAAVFRQAVTELQDAIAGQSELRPELTFEQEPPPRRLAPHAIAVAATVSTGTDEPDVASGRFVLLFDPAGQRGWDGRYRVICYVRAELEPEMASDPLINAVGWSWLTEALETGAAAYQNVSGTVTTVVTQGFGAKQDEPMSTGFELRASWTPAVSSGGYPSQPPAEGEPALAAHLAAWCGVLCAAAGLPPVAPGVATLRSPRRRRRP